MSWTDPNVRQGMMVPLSGDEGDPVPAKKRTAASEKELKATVKKLRSKLERSDARSAHWKKKTAQLEKTVGQLEKAAAKSETRVAKLTKRLEESRADGVPQPAAEPAPEQVQAPSDDTTDTAGAQSGGAPDSSWTVVQLRAEARARGLTGLSNKSKSQLLDALG
jgi:lysophospholipase